jgi:hypothetical protein
VKRYSLLDILATLAAPSRCVVVYSDGSILLLPVPGSDSRIEIVHPEISE